jgi:hypothetical protein
VYLPNQQNPLAFGVIEAELKKKQLAKKQEAELSVKTTWKSKQTKKPVDHYEESNQYQYEEEDVQESESGLDSDIYGVLSLSGPVVKPHLTAVKWGLTPGLDSLTSPVLCGLDLGRRLS